MSAMAFATPGTKDLNESITQRGSGDLPRNSDKTPLQRPGAEWPNEPERRTPTSRVPLTSRQVEEGIRQRTVACHGVGHGDGDSLKYEIQRLCGPIEAWVAPPHWPYSYFITFAQSVSVERAVRLSGEVRIRGQVFHVEPQPDLRPMTERSAASEPTLDRRSTTVEQRRTEERRMQRKRAADDTVVTATYLPFSVTGRLAPGASSLAPDVPLPVYPPGIIEPHPFPLLMNSSLLEPFNPFITSVYKWFTQRRRLEQPPATTDSTARGQAPL